MSSAAVVISTLYIINTCSNAFLALFVQKMSVVD